MIVVFISTTGGIPQAYSLTGDIIKELQDIHKAVKEHNLVCLVVKELSDVSLMGIDEEDVLWIERE